MAGDNRHTKNDMRRFFVDPSDIDESTAKIFDEEFIHMTRVLRSKPGETFVLLDGSGLEYTAVLAALHNDYAEFNISGKTESLAEPKTKVTLYQGMPKSAKLDLIIQKAVELGVFAIVPFVSMRCVKVPKDFGKKSDRLSKIATEAVKQSRRATVPNVGDLLDFKGLVKVAATHQLTLLCYEDETATSLKQALASSNATDMAVIIGPEGGFDAGESDKLCQAGAVSVSLGPRILRTETAGLAVLAQVLYEKEQA